MPQAEKYRLLNDLIQPLGYRYLPEQDIFFTTFDAWQRDFGYTRSYDCFAPCFDMVFDSEPVYFNYDNRTWLIEFWKGQYGINTGAEIGIYCADKIVPPEKRNKELFHTVSNEEIPHFSMNLKRSEKKCERNIAKLSMMHWWLAAFRMGCFSRPEELCAEFCINFPDCDMTHAFAGALIQLGYKPCLIQICGCRVCFSFTTPVTPVPCNFLTKLIRCPAQWKNHFFCRIYRIVTRPFCCTSDRLLYLYYYLPFAFRHCLRLRRCKKRRTEKNKCCKKCQRSSSRNKLKHRGGKP